MDENGNRIGTGLRFAAQVIDSNGNVVATVNLTANSGATVIRGLESGKTYFLREMQGEHFSFGGFDAGVGNTVAKDYIIFRSTLSSENVAGNIYITLTNISSEAEIELIDPEIPLGWWPDVDLNDTDIIEIVPEEIPLTATPQTGDSGIAVATVALTVSLCGVMALVVIHKKRKKN